LAAEWRWLRETCCKHRFGRAELLPIKKTGEAVARYVAGYLSKSFGLVPSGRKNRLVRYSRSLSQRFTMRFSPQTPAISFTGPGSSWRRPCCIKSMIAAHSALLRKFTELAFDEAAEMRWQESRSMEADNIDVGPATETDLQSDLIEGAGNPF